MIGPKFWANRTPPPDYFREVNPYEDHRTGRTNLPIIDHLKLSKYVTKTGKKATDISFEEMQQFIVVR